MSPGSERNPWPPQHRYGARPRDNGGGGPPPGPGFGAGEGAGATGEGAGATGATGEGAGATREEGSETAEERPLGAVEGAPEGAAEGEAPAATPAAEADLGALLVGVERQRDEYLDALRRLQAEFDNYRKRVDRHQSEVADNAAGALVKKLLPALDAADLALAHGGGEDVKQVAATLFDALSKEGLERIDPEGQAFNPEHHDAIAHEPAEDPGDQDAGGPLVSEVMRAGYRWRGRVLRPAMVKVRG